MEEIKAPKKERKFLKAVGNIAKVLANELVMGIARKFIGKAIDKVGNKKQGLSIVLIILASSFAFAQYPTTSNKQRLGFQTTGDGLTWRGSLSDTASIQPINNQNAWVILDTVNLKFYSFDFTSNVWNLVGGAPGLTMPFDSITFNTAKDGTVGVGEVEYNDTQGSLIQGLKGGLVTNVIGQQLHQRVNNRTGATLNKGDVVYLSGSQGNRITVAKAIATSDPTSANTFGIVAEQILNNASGYIITEGLITNINTSALTQDSAVYLSGTTSGALTSTKPQAPIHGVYIGVCVKTNAGSGEVFVKIRNGQELDELHDVQISNPTNNASLYFKSSEGLWRDTTAALLTSDTASMLTPYFRDADTTSLNLTSRFAAKLNLSDTASMLTNYLRTGTAASTYVPLNTESTMNATLNINGNLNMGSGGVISTPILSAGTIIKQGGTSSQFLKANGDVDSSTYLTTGSAASTYLPLTGGTLSGDLGISKSSNSILRLSSADAGSYGKLIFSSNNGSFLNYGASIESSGDGVGVDVGSLNFLTGFGTVRTNRMTITPSGNLSIINSATIGGTLGVTGAISSESILLPYNKSSGFSQFSLFQNANSFVISGGTGGIQFNNNNNSNALVKIFNNGNFKISNNQTDNGYKFEVDGTTGLQGTLTVNSSAVFNEGSAVADFRVESDNNANMLFVDGTNNRVGIGYASPTKTLDVNGEVRINTVTATPSSLLGKDGSNVVGEVTTVAQTGLMTRGETTATTGSPSAIFTVTHGLGFNPSSVIVTSAGIGGGNKILFEVYTKNSTTFSVQAWNLDGTEAASKEVKIYWLAIK